MNALSTILLLVFLGILFLTKQVFWVIVAGLLLLAYMLTLASKSAGHGVRKAGKKVRAVYEGEMKEMEGTLGKYPAKFFDSVGKGAVEKINEYQAPKGAKSYREAKNSRWAIKNPAEKLGDIVQKTLDGLGKLFGK
jgi:hypothetical protein